jgi:hypothetical protein
VTVWAKGMKATCTKQTPWTWVVSGMETGPGINKPVFGVTYTVRQVQREKEGPFLLLEEIHNLPTLASGREPAFDGRHFSEDNNRQPDVKDDRFADVEQFRQLVTPAALKKFRDPMPKPQEKSDAV